MHITAAPLFIDDVTCICKCTVRVTKVDKVGTHSFPLDFSFEIEAVLLAFTELHLW